MHNVLCLCVLPPCRGLDPEEPVTSSAYLCSFHDLEIQVGAMHAYVLDMHAYALDMHAYV